MNSHEAPRARAAAGWRRRGLVLAGGLWLLAQALGLGHAVAHAGALAGTAHGHGAPRHEVHGHELHGHRVHGDREHDPLAQGHEVHDPREHGHDGRDGWGHDAGGAECRLIDTAAHDLALSPSPGWPQADGPRQAVPAARPSAAVLRQPVLARARGPPAGGR